MSVTGYLALYTTLIGWQQYQNLWALMVGTGLVFIPFIAIVLTNFLQPFESQEPKNASVVTLRRLMIQIVGALLIIEFCCVPTVPLNPRVLHFEPVCVANPKLATPGHTGTTYDNEFPVPTGVKVPIIWYLVMAVSNGFTHAAIEGIECQKINYRQLQTTLDVTHITSPQLKKETIAFYNDCYVPAYSRYLVGNLNALQKADINRFKKKYGRDDMGWIGSQTLLKTPGFYDTLSAEQPVKGFLFDPVRDQFEGQVSNHSKWGQPSCVAWWTNPENGLQIKLEKSLPKRFLTEITHLSDNSKQIADLAIRNLIKHSFDPGMTFGEISRGYESLDDEIHGNWISDTIGSSIGIGLEELTYYPKLALLINALPVIQALLLMSIYALLALMIPFSRFRLHFIITGSAAIFAITFWSYLWHLVLYLDNTLIPALYPKNRIFGGSDNAIFLDFIIGTLYIVLPMLFLILMSWAGLKISQSIMGAVTNMQSPGVEAGKQAGGVAKQVGTTMVGGMINKSK